MAKNVPAKGKKATKKKDLLLAFKKLGRFFKDVVTELKKVTWPTKKELISYSTVVVIFVAIVGVVVYLMDLGLAKLLSIISGS
jgi:preprotein translocase subunit SecE